MRRRDFFKGMACIGRRHDGRREYISCPASAGNPGGDYYGAAAGTADGSRTSAVDAWTDGCQAAAERAGSRCRRPDACKFF